MATRLDVNKLALKSIPVLKLENLNHETEFVSLVGCVNVVTISK